MEEKKQRDEDYKAYEQNMKVMQGKYKK